MNNYTTKVEVSITKEDGSAVYYTIGWPNSTKSSLVLTNLIKPAATLSLVVEAPEVNISKRVVTAEGGP